MGKLVKITIDGQEFKVEEGDKLLWVALENGIYIPHLCAVKEEKRPSASCRLCYVQVEGREKPVTACTLPVSDGLVVHTRSERVDRLVRAAFDLLLSDHRLGCGRCPAKDYCALRVIARERGLKLKSSFNRLEKDLEMDDSHERFVYDPSRCVLCGRCVWACRHEAGAGVLGFARRGIKRAVMTFENVKLAAAGCRDCDACVRACPVGALFFKAEKAGCSNGCSNGTAG